MTPEDEKLLANGCQHCDNTGWVCEDHEDKPWGGVSARKDACICGGAGMPCVHCNELGVDTSRVFVETFSRR